MNSSSGLAWQRFYPVEGDSAVAELWCADKLWATLHLDGLRLEAVGAARTEGAKEVLTLFPPVGPSAFSADGKTWTLDASTALEQVREARAWLFENEHSRQPE